MPIDFMAALEHIRNNQPSPQQPSASLVPECRCPTCGQLTEVDLSARCPRCGKAMLIRRNKKSNSQFIGCSGYPECKQTFTMARYKLFTAKPITNPVIEDTNLRALVMD